MSSNIVLIRFAERLKQIRIQKGLSQEALALMCDVDRTYIGRIEALKRNPSLAILQKIADGLNMSLSDLLTF